MFCLQSILLNRMYPRILTRDMNWVKSCGQFSVKFEEGLETTLALVRMWDRDTFRRVCVVVLSKYSGDASQDAAVLGQLLSVVGPSVSLVALVRGSHVLRDTYLQFTGSEYRENFVEYPIFDLRLLKGCLQKSASVVLGSLDPFSMTEFIIVTLKGAEHKDWMVSGQALRRAVVSGDLSMPSLVEHHRCLGLIVSFLPETGRKTDGDSLVVQYTSWVGFRIQFRN